MKMFHIFLVLCCGILFGCMEKTDKWMALGFEKNTMSTEFVTSDILVPDFSADGKIKFIESESGYQLGYLINVDFDSLDQNLIPEAYKVERKIKINDKEIQELPVTSLTVYVDVKFSLLDKDGFVVDSLTAENLSLVTGSNNSRKNNVLQGTLGTFKKYHIDRVALVKVSFFLKGCAPCNSR